MIQPHRAKAGVISPIPGTRSGKLGVRLEDDVVRAMEEECSKVRYGRCDGDDGRLSSVFTSLFPICA